MAIGREVEDGSDVLIECRDVHKSFGEKQILKGLSFKVNFFFHSFFCCYEYVIISFATLLEHSGAIVIVEFRVNVAADG